MRILEVTNPLNVLHNPRVYKRILATLTEYHGSESEARELIDSYSQAVDRLNHGGGTVYRAVWVERGDKPRLDNAGLHWSLTQEGAVEYLTSNAGVSFAEVDDLNDAVGYVLAAVTGPNNITNHGVDLAGQLDEQEVRLVNPAAARIRVVQKVDNIQW